MKNIVEHYDFLRIKLENKFYIMNLSYILQEL